MTNLTREKKRALASLKTLPGYHVLLDDVVKWNRDEALKLLKLASGTEQIVNAALVFRAWDDMTRLVEEVTQNALDELKAEGDTIYG